jgi:hypothetical protein
MYLSEIKDIVQSMVEEALYTIDSIVVEESNNVIKLEVPYPDAMLKEITNAGMEAGISDTNFNEIEISIKDRYRIMRWLIHKGYSSRDIKKKFPELMKL